MKAVSLLRNYSKASYDHTAIYRRLLMRVTSKLFIADLEAGIESGENYKSKGQLMQDALLDPRIAESPTDYSLS